MKLCVFFSILRYEYAQFTYFLYKANGVTATRKSSEKRFYPVQYHTRRPPCAPPLSCSTTSPFPKSRAEKHGQMPAALFGCDSLRTGQVGSDENTPEPPYLHLACNKITSAGRELHLYHRPASRRAKISRPGGARFVLTLSPAEVRR